MDFGEVALAGGFLKSPQFASEMRYPLHLSFCPDCYAVQVPDKVNARVLFSDYFYFSSSIRTLREHFAEYAGEVTERFLNPASAAVLEFGCNDGVLLRPLADRGIRTVIGVDPATNVVNTINDPRVKIVNDFFTEAVAAQVVRNFGQVDVVMANNVYAHIPDIQDVTRAVDGVLKDDGVFIFEVHYLTSLIEGMQYDMIYHEHLYYYSLLSAMRHFARYGMIVFDVKPVPIHAGSMRFYVCKQSSRHAAQVSERVTALEREERARGYDDVSAFQQFAARVATHKHDLISLLHRLKASGARIAGYGASGRANTIIQYCGIGREQLDYMIDDAPAKAGFYTPGSHLLIQSSSVLGQPNPPDYLLLFAWSFLEEIKTRCADYLKGGGRLIVPLPHVRIIDGVNHAGEMNPATFLS
jgi:methylation protein EvaC